ncbi:MAG TPA: hypothetical protein VFQ38_03375, partial [Longimicrobiales bacterium]|nr:hypothetical protein [Longimicrobiales bacterium]
GSREVAAADPSGSPAAPPGGAAGVAAAIADPVGLLGRLFDRVGPPYPERASLEAIYDSARALWPIQSLGPARRGEAAYVAGVAAAGLGEPAQCVRWVSRALTLKPDSRGYRVMLDNCRSGAP